MDRWCIHPALDGLRLLNTKISLVLTIGKYELPGMKTRGGQSIVSTPSLAFRESPGVPGSPREYPGVSGSTPGVAKNTPGVAGSTREYPGVPGSTREYPGVPGSNLANGCCICRI